MRGAIRRSVKQANSMPDDVVLRGHAKMNEQPSPASRGRFSLNYGDSQLLDGNRSSKEPSWAEFVLEVRRHSSSRVMAIGKT
jgi:hypothetical protein